MRKLPDVVNWVARFLQGIDSVWERDAEFISIYHNVAKGMLIDKKKSYVLYNLVKNVGHLNGHFAELGVFRGASSKIMIEANKRNKAIYLFDTFDGLPKTHDMNDHYWKKDDMSETSLEEVKQLINYPKAEYFKGFFPETTKNIRSDQTFSFVHIDVDIYQSMVDGCDYFYNRMVHSGVMLFDYYGDLSFPGARKAVDEFF